MLFVENQKTSAAVVNKGDGCFTDFTQTATLMASDGQFSTLIISIQRFREADLIIQRIALTMFYTVSYTYVLD